MELTDKQLEIEKFTKDVLGIVNQYKKGKQSYHIKNEYISVDGENIIIDNEYLDYLFVEEEEDNI
jgi:hypothetical protein